MTVISLGLCVHLSSPSTIFAEIVSNEFKFSKPGGFYTEDTTLEIMSQYEDSKIYYTLDGSTPTLESKVYTGPIDIKKMVASKDDISYIRTTPVHENVNGWGWKEPTGEVKKGTVVKAIEVSLAGEVSNALTQTYWVDEKGSDRYSMPIVSISTDPEKLFGYDEGIYVPGKSFDDNLPWSIPWGPGNYKDKLRIDANIEFYDEDGSLVYSREALIRIKGSTSASLPQKSIKIHKPIKFEVFPDIRDINGKRIKEHGRLVLRNSGQAFLSTHFTDAMSQSLVKDTNVATQAYRPAIVFINGEYWGIQEMREDYDERYLASHYKVDDKKVDFLESSSKDEYGLEVEAGSIDHYAEMINYMRDNDVSDNEVYDKLATMMDIDNYTSYNAMEIYFQNTDWPHNNAALWRYQTEYNENAPYGQDGRWRWMLYDTDYGFGGNDAHELVGTTEHAYGRNSIKDAKRHELFNTLLQNEEFKNQFINKLGDYLNTIFTPRVVNNKIDDMSQRLSGEMQEHIDRWGYPAKDLNDWNKQVSRLKVFAENRPEKVRGHLLSEFNLSGMSNLNVSIEDYNKGSVKLNSLSVDSGNKDFSGVYFKDVPVDIKAVPNDGYIFLMWEGIQGDDKYNPNIKLELTEDTKLEAIFVKLYEIDVENASGETREVNFNNELNPESINTENFYISEKEDGSNRLENVSVLFKEGSQKSVRISPEPDTLKHGITYYLFVRPEVESAIGNKINRFTRIKFNIN